MAKENSYEEINLSNGNYDYAGITGFKEGSYTQEASDNLRSTWEGAGESFKGSFSVEYTSFDNFGKDAAGSVINYTTAGNAYKSSLKATAAIGSAASNIQDWDKTQYLQAVDASHAATLDYLNDKLKGIIRKLSATSEVTVGALLGEVAPFAMNPNAAWSSLTKRFKELPKMLSEEAASALNLNDLSLNALGQDVLSNILSDETVVNSIANINAVQAVAASASAICSVWNTAANILKTIEPLLPPIEILSAMAGIWINPALATEASEKSVPYGQMLLDWAMSKASALLKKYIFSIKLTVPELLLKTVNTLSVKSAVTDWSWGETGGAGRAFASLATNSYERISDDEWSKVADKYITDNAWNPNNLKTKDGLARIGISNEDYARIIGNSLDRIIRTSQSALKIDMIASSAYKSYSDGTISFLGSFSYAWDISSNPSGIHQTTDYSNPNTVDTFVRKATDFFNQPDRRLLVSGKTVSEAEQLRTITMEQV